jgi:hypothetical protein
MNQFSHLEVGSLQVFGHKNNNNTRQKQRMQSVLKQEVATNNDNNKAFTYS